MAIEGPLRELGIHDVFQLLDLSRKTGVLRVASELREDEGLVYFDGGRVVHASIRSKTVAPELALLQAGRIAQSDLDRARARQANGRAGARAADLLVEIGAISARELERHLRLQIESVVFELMSWHEGFFSFEERPRDDMPHDGTLSVTVSTESLLMEGARRIDEWSRIAEVVTNVDVVPELAPVQPEREGSVLDLLPHEWQVLTMIDGERSLREIAASLGRDEFEVAKIAYGLVTTGVIVLRAPERRAQASGAVGVDTWISSARDLTKHGRYAEALEELRRAVQEDPLTPRIHLALGFASARVGDLAAARSSWEHFLRLAPADPSASRARAGLDAVARLQSVLEADDDV